MELYQIFYQRRYAKTAQNFKSMKLLQYSTAYSINRLELWSIIHKGLWTASPHLFKTLKLVTHLTLGNAISHHM